MTVKQIRIKQQMLAQRGKILLLGLATSLLVLPFASFTSNKIKLIHFLIWTFIVLLSWGIYAYKKNQIRADGQSTLEREACEYGEQVVFNHCSRLINSGHMISSEKLNIKGYLIEGFYGCIYFFVFMMYADVLGYLSLAVIIMMIVQSMMLVAALHLMLVIPLKYECLFLEDGVLTGNTFYKYQEISKHQYIRLKNHDYFLEMNNGDLYLSLYVNGQDKKIMEALIH